MSHQIKANQGFIDLPRRTLFKESVVRQQDAYVIEHLIEFAWRRVQNKVRSDPHLSQQENYRFVSFTGFGVSTFSESLIGSSAPAAIVKNLRGREESKQSSDIAGAGCGAASLSLHWLAEH